MLKLWEPTRHPMNWLRKGFRTQRGYLRFLVRARNVGYDINVGFLLFTLSATFNTRVGFSENATEVICWILVIVGSVKEFYLPRIL